MKRLDGANQMKSGTENKLKFKQLQLQLELTLWQTRGLLDTLWKFVGDNCPTGDIGRFTDQEIAIGIDWRDDPQLLVSKLVETKWLDAHPEHRLVVHDWPEHCEDTVHKVLARRTDIFADGTLPKLSRFDKVDRPSLLKSYCQKYGKKSVENGRVETCVPVRTQTPNYAPALPSLTQPSLAQPSPANPSAEPPAVRPECDGRLAGGSSASVTWETIADRLAAMGASRWREAIDKATASGCTPAFASQVIDFAAENSFEVGAILYRLSRSRPSMPMDAGWPDKPKPVKAAEAAEAKRKAERVQVARKARAGQIIKEGRKKYGANDEPIRAELRAEGLEWPE